MFGESGWWGGNKEGGKVGGVKRRCVWEQSSLIDLNTGGLDSSLDQTQQIFAKTGLISLVKEAWAVCADPGPNDAPQEYLCQGAKSWQILIYIIYLASAC